MKGNFLACGAPVAAAFLFRVGLLAGSAAVSSCAATPAPAVAATDSVAAADAATSADGAPTDSGKAATDASAGDAGKADTSADTAPADIAKADAVKAPCKPWDLPADWNCPADTHCGYDDADVIACMPNGKHGVAEDCGDGLGCKVGICVKSENGTEACAPFCTVDAQCDSQSCNGITGKKYKTCDVAKYVTCNPLAAKCPVGQGCYLLGPGFVCVGAGSKDKGDSCKSNQDCKPGFTCTGLSEISTSTGICRKVCSKTGDTGCEDPTTKCSNLGGNVGYCEE